MDSKFSQSSAPSVNSAKIRTFAPVNNQKTMRYLDPKNDLTFKRVFGEHPDLLISLLNALLPLDEGNEVVSIEYLPAELVPDIPEFKNSIVDVRCRDLRGRQFIVEMQMLWTASFKSRVLFNASKAYVRQIRAAKKYSSLEPVYALSILDDTFLPADKHPHYYHHYSIIHTEDPDEKLEGLEFVFVELPKFEPRNLAEKRMAVLWMRFLTEIEDRVDNDYQDLRDSCDEISRALEILEESSFSADELDSYDRYWDSVRVEKTYADERAELAHLEGLVEGEKIGIDKGITEGENRAIEKTVVNSHKAGIAIETIAVIAGISIEQVRDILIQNGFAVK